MDGGQFAEAPKTGADPRPPTPRPDPIVGALFGVFFMLCWPRRVAGCFRLIWLLAPMSRLCGGRTAGGQEGRAAGQAKTVESIIYGT